MVVASRDYTAFMAELRSVRSEFDAAVAELKAATKIFAPRHRYCTALYENALN